MFWQQFFITYAAIVSVLLASGIGCQKLPADSSRNADASRRSTPQEEFQWLREWSLAALNDGRLTLTTIPTSKKEGRASGVQSVLGDPVIAQGPSTASNHVRPSLAVKIWGRLAIAKSGEWQPGAYVNLAKHTWKPGETFFLCLETAAPVQLSLFELQANGDSKMFFPDKDREHTFATILPGNVWMSDALLLRDDADDETMGVMLVRADSGVLPINGAPVLLPPSILIENVTRVLANGKVVAEAISVASANGGEVEKTAPPVSEARNSETPRPRGGDGAATSEDNQTIPELSANVLHDTWLTQDALGKFSYSASKGGASAREAIAIRQEVIADAETGDSPDDVAWLFVGSNGVGFRQFVMRKQSVANVTGNPLP